jgi:hypothetical protein
MDCQARGGKCKKTQKEKWQKNIRSKSRLPCRHMLRVHRSYPWDSHGMLFKLTNKATRSLVSMMATLCMNNLSTDTLCATLHGYTAGTGVELISEKDKASRQSYQFNPKVETQQRDNIAYT